MDVIFNFYLFLMVEDYDFMLNYVLHLESYASDFNTN